MKFLGKTQPEEDIFHDSMSTENEVCRNMFCLNKSTDLKVAQCELKMQNRLIQELEKSNKNLSTIISLLNSKNESEVSRNQNKNITSVETGYRGRSPAVSVGTANPSQVTVPSALTSIARHRKSISVDNQTQKDGTSVTPHKSRQANSEMLSHSVETTLISAVQPTDNEGWKDVRHKRRKPIVGTHIENNGTTLVGVPKMAVLHVSRLAPETTSEIMKNYLKSHFPEVSVETVNSKYPERYASFKISIYDRNFKSAMNPELWPRDCCVERFFFRRKTAELTR